MDGISDVHFKYTIMLNTDIHRLVDRFFVMGYQYNLFTPISAFKPNLWYFIQDFCYRSALLLPNILTRYVYFPSILIYM